MNDCAPLHNFSVIRGRAFMRHKFYFVLRSSYLGSNIRVLFSVTLIRGSIRPCSHLAPSSFVSCLSNWDAFRASLARVFMRNNCQMSTPLIPSNIRNIKAMNTITTSPSNSNPFIRAITATIIPSTVAVAMTIDQIIDSIDFSSDLELLLPLITLKSIPQRLQ